LLTLANLIFSAQSNMFKVNEYFDGKVKSIEFQTDEGVATVGVMAAGEYEFSTSMVEYMTVTSGLMSVLLPEAREWKDFRDFETFKVAKGQKFQVKVIEDTSYRCLYK
jgi:purine/pyrimidine-nucleoside phosphorylase